MSEQEHRRKQEDEHLTVVEQLEDADKLLELQQIDIDASQSELAATQERAWMAEAEAVDLEANAAEQQERMLGVMTEGNQMLKQELAKAQQQDQRIRGDAAVLMRQLAAAEEEVGVLKQALEMLKAELAAARKELASLAAQARAQATLKEALANAWGQQSDLSFLLLAWCRKLPALQGSSASVVLDVHDSLIVDGDEGDVVQARMHDPTHAHTRTCALATFLLR